MQAGIELGIYPKDAQKMVAQSVKMSRTRRARPVSSMAARSSELHWGGMDSKFWK